MTSIDVNDNSEVVLVRVACLTMSVVVSLASLFCSLASFGVAVWAVLVSKNSLNQAQQVAERDLRDWRQRKWYDLYFIANDAYDMLDRFQIEYSSPTSIKAGSTEYYADWNNLMATVRKLHTAAMVFPRDQAINAVVEATGHFDKQESAFQKHRLAKLLAGLEALRQKALVNTDVLGD